MTDSDVADRSEEIDLSEIAATIRPVIPVAIAIGLLFGIGTFLVTRNFEKQYTATAWFAIESSGQRSMPDMGGLNAFLPGGQGSDESGRANDKILSRDFITDLFEITRTIDGEPMPPINEDQFFTGTGEEEGLVTRVVSFVTGETPQMTEAQVLARIVDTYRKAVQIIVKENDVIELRVTHPDPERAAKLANRITQAHLDNLDMQQFEDDQRQIRLMEEELIDAQKKLDDAMEASRRYAVENSVRATEDLGASSLRLPRFRREAGRIELLDGGKDLLDLGRPNVNVLTDQQVVGNGAGGALQVTVVVKVTDDLPGNESVQRRIEFQVTELAFEVLEEGRFIGGVAARRGVIFFRAAGVLVAAGVVFEVLLKVIVVVFRITFFAVRLPFFPVGSVLFQRSGFLQRRVAFQLFFDALLQFHNRQLHQLHELNLTGAELLLLRLIEGLS